MNLLDVLLLVAGIAVGVIASRFALKALYLQRLLGTTPSAAQPSASDASERGDLGSIPKQNFWR